MSRKSTLRYTGLQARDAIELLGEKWRIAILHLLRNGDMRTHQLQKEIEEISPKMLTQTLRGMERDGLIYRTVYLVAPSRVEYGLTKMGHGVIQPVQDLCHWAEAHVKERDAARAKFDLAYHRDRGSKRTTRTRQ